MSTAGSETRIGKSPDDASVAVSALTSQLVPLYDELAELEALNSFLYDAFLTLAAENDGAFSASSSSGLGLTCQWLRQRQIQLKQQLYQLIQHSKSAAESGEKPA